MPDRPIFFVLRRHAEIPDSMAWAELGIKVPEARAIVAHIDDLQRRIDRLATELTEARAKGGN